MDQEHKDIMDRIDKVLDIVSDIQQDRAVLKDNVLKLEAVDSNTRLTKLETRNRVIQWVGGAVVSAMGVAITYIKLVQGN